MVLDVCKLARPQLLLAAGGGGGGGEKAVGGANLDTIAAEFFPGYKTLEELLSAMGVDVPKVCSTAAYTYSFVLSEHLNLALNCLTRS